LAATSLQVDAEDYEDAQWLLALYGPDAPPRSVTLLEYADSNIEWSSSGFGSLPTGGPFYGHEAFGRHIGAARQLYGSYSLQLDGQIQVGNTLALHGRLLLEELAGQPEAAPHWFQALTIRDRKILRGIEVLDSLALARIIENRPLTATPALPPAAPLPAFTPQDDVGDAPAEDGGPGQPKEN
jgi:hypothetical protein